MPVFWSIAGFSLVAGLFSAVLVETFLDERIAIIGSFVGLQKSFNDGIAFGINLPGQEILIVIALILVVVMGIRAKESRWQSIGFGLIVGGGVGNVIDRFLDGQVTDVFQVGSFPIFNVADSCITIGVGLLLVDMLLKEVHKDQCTVHNE